jgi:hypothetical protein
MMTSVTLLVMRGLVVKRPITSPCHGEDRRFESGRARQEHKDFLYAEVRIIGYVY